MMIMSCEQILIESGQWRKPNASPVLCCLLWASLTTLWFCCWHFKDLFFLRYLGDFAVVENQEVFNEACNGQYRNFLKTTWHWS